jgi:hypothetical protein
LSKTPKTGRKVLAHLAGAGVYILITLVGMIAYALLYKATGPKVGGMVGGAIIVFLPVMLLLFGLINWGPSWVFIKHKRGEVRPRNALGIAALLSFLGTIFYCQGGFRCFMTGSTEHLVGWFFVIFAALGAASHSAIYRRLTK